MITITTSNHGNGFIRLPLPVLLGRLGQVE
jgi:hypothetical protein